MKLAKYHCQNCSADFDAPNAEPPATVRCPNCAQGGCQLLTDDAVDQTPDNQIQTGQGVEDKPEATSTTVDDPDSRDSADEWLQELPPKFMVDDPEFVDRRLGTPADARVLIPDGRGGVQGVQQNIVRIEHKGEMIELIALSPEEKRRRQWIINIVSIVVGILILVAFFRWI